MKSFKVLMILTVLIVASIALTGVASAVPAGTSDSNNNVSALMVINDGSANNVVYNTYIDQGSMDDTLAIYNNTTGMYTFSQSWVTGFFNSISDDLGF